MVESGEPGSLYAAVGTETNLVPKASGQTSRPKGSVFPVKPRRSNGLKGCLNPWYHRPRLGNGQRRRPSSIRNYTCVIGCVGLPMPCLECVAHRARRYEAKRRSYRKKKGVVRAAAEGLLGLAPENPECLEVCGAGNVGHASGTVVASLGEVNPGPALR